MLIISYMFVRVLSGTTVGLDGVLIRVEVDVAKHGFPKFNIVGLPSKSVEEAKERVRTAIINSSFSMPETRITVNLAPADIPKNGSSLDLPIAIGILAASGSIKTESLKDGIFVGELSLIGEIRKVPGALSVAIMAKSKKIKKLFIPPGCAAEAALISSIEIYAVNNLTELALHLNEVNMKPTYPTTKIENLHSIDSFKIGFENINGQEAAKRALEIAAAGFHNVHLKGPPGAGKTLLSRAFPSILPLMVEQEIIEVTKIYSVAGMLKDVPYIYKRPFRNPHHTVSRIGLIGGGSNPTPGEISLSHRGVLFLDEFTEFAHSTIESLRAPIEDGEVSISRASGTLTFPSKFILLAASNPCPCGFLGHPTKFCQCLPGAIFKYKKKISGPILDRIDINVDVPPVTRDKLTENYKGELSEAVRNRVVNAHKRQQKRFEGTTTMTNSAMTGEDIKKHCLMTSNAENLLKSAIDRLFLSARGYFKTIKIARTIADLGKLEKIDDASIAEALQFRAIES